MFQEDSLFAGDFVEYRLFLLNDLSPNIEQLQCLLVSINQFISKCCIEHLWQKDPFRLSIIEKSIENRNNNNNDKNNQNNDNSKKKNDCLREKQCLIRNHRPAHLAGRSYVGDNIEDEWFIVYVLKMISRQFGDLAVSVVDADGEFLLIESAQHVPTWLDPDNSENRMWLACGGKWCLLSNNAGQSLSLCCALTQLSEARGNSASLLASPAVCSAIDERVDAHPQLAREQSRHVVRCRVTRDVATLLAAQPQLVAPAVDAFYTREPADIAACTAMKRFGRRRSDEPLVDVSVRFTRCLYAQMARQQFFAPRNNTTFNVPDDERHVDRHACQLGMQLTCGFEMLAARAVAGNKDDALLRSTDACWPLPPQINDDDDDDESCAKLARCLVADNDNSMSTWLWHVFDADDTAALLALCNRVCAYAERVDAPLYTIVNDDAQNDSDEWLNIAPADVDSVLQKRFDNLDDVDLAISSDEGESNDDDDGDDDDDDDDDNNDENNESKTKEDDLFNSDRFSKLIDTMERFVQHESDIDGVVAPDNNGAPVQFDENAFFKVMSDALKRVADGESIEDMDEEQLQDIEYAEQLEAELANSTLAKSFVRVADKNQTKPDNDDNNNERNETDDNNDIDDDDLDDDDEEKPVDVNMNLVKNLLDSFAMQQGRAGPATTMLDALQSQKAPKRK